MQALGALPLFCLSAPPLGQGHAASLPHVPGPLPKERPNKDVGARPHAIGPDRFPKKKSRRCGTGDELPLSRPGKDLPYSVGLPDAVLLGRNEHLVEIARYLSQRQPIGPALSHHSDRRLLGLVFHELVVEVVEAKGQVTSPFVTVAILRDSKSIQGLYHHRTANVGKPGDFAGGKVLFGVESAKVGSAP